MAVRKSVEPKTTDITMSDIKELINEKFTDSDKYSKLQFDSIQLQLKIVTSDVSDLRTEVKDISTRLIVIDKEDALHYLTCPNTSLAPDIKSIIAAFPLLKSNDDENRWIKKYIKPLSIGYGVIALIFIISAITLFIKFGDIIPDIRSNTSDMQEMKAYIETLKKKEVRSINNNLMK